MVRNISNKRRQLSPTKETKFLSSFLLHLSAIQLSEILGTSSQLNNGAFHAARQEQVRKELSALQLICMYVYKTSLVELAFLLVWWH